MVERKITGSRGTDKRGDVLYRREEPVKASKR